MSSIRSDKRTASSADLAEGVADALEERVDVSEDIWDKAIANCRNAATSSCTVAFGDSNIFRREVEFTAN